MHGSELGAARFFRHLEQLKQVVWYDLPPTLICEIVLVFSKGLILRRQAAHLGRRYLKFVKYYLTKFNFI